MAKKYVRDEEKYEQFLAYIREAGLEDGIREICQRHGVVPREIFLDFRGPTIIAARVEVWWWLSTSRKKSHLEIGRIFHREYTSITHCFKRLKETASRMGKQLDPDTVHDAAIAWTDELLESRRAMGDKIRAIRKAKRESEGRSLSPRGDRTTGSNKK